MFALIEGAGNHPRNLNKFFMIDSELVLWRKVEKNPMVYMREWKEPEINYAKSVENK